MRGDEKIYLATKSVYWNPDFPLREYLQAVNTENYERQTKWVFVEGPGYQKGRAGEPDVVFLTANLPRSPVQLEWLRDPAYEVTAQFPGKIKVFGVDNPEE